MCGSEAKDVAGTCCGAERKEHDHTTKEEKGVCPACHGEKGAHTCNA